MASKSRLGKGLGALFPDLPGDETVEKKVKSPENAKKVAETKSATKVLASAATSVATPGKASSNVKKNMAKRAAMPALDDIAHPSDLFFGSDSPQPQLPVADLPKATSKDVSRETSKPAKTAKSGKDEEKLELKPVQGGYLAELKLSDIGPNVHQPRTIFDEDELNELSASIKEVGVLQPIVVRKRPADQIAEAKAKKDDQESSANPFAGHLDSPYELIMGERRWRASQLAGLETIPAIVKTTADDDMLRDALLENLHRVALNPLEEAAAYQQMIDEFGLTQAQLSKSVSKSRPQIANMLRLLNLPAAVQKKVAAGVLSSGHARALLGLSDPEEMDKLASRIISEGLSVRSTEEIVAMKIASGEQPKKPKKSKTNPWVGSAVQQSLENHFDTKVSIKGTQKHGRIEIVFSSPEDMDRILKLLVPNQPGSGDSESKWV
ncbi:ParB/RepB/Spo0J family partition protein [Bifidobacterium imperatoris]|uniref:Chromosome partitioning protein ParB n=1 Tax=Bifidobacterium imperatoris TaxID=2020965 RepID=A0A2N5IUU3_9BIFI|nr:ParB/RepB/Spo0J family partition protein [Bifidobacterium imperatoris]PLS25743.1 chromosome partitioning protein ParB [Bifidobacterium imperatoris]QSY58350.1 ParB/RepB/Spo0J family partition protein [Bifidobacterium imperatoris]